MNSGIAGPRSLKEESPGASCQSVYRKGGCERRTPRDRGESCGAAAGRRCEIARARGHVPRARALSK
eukprot:2650183-Rhodomonas_salina.1